MLKSNHVTAFVWDVHFTVPTFDFYFKVVLPKARKARDIIERDSLGRIVRANVSKEHCLVN